MTLRSVNIIKSRSIAIPTHPLKIYWLSDVFVSLRTLSGDYIVEMLLDFLILAAGVSGET